MIKTLLLIVVLLTYSLASYCASMEIIGCHSFYINHCKNRIPKEIEITEIAINDILHKTDTYKSIEEKLEELVKSRRIIDSSV